MKTDGTFLFNNYGTFDVFDKTLSTANEKY
jgi:hypothetical protein